jgi:hypothetical protein
MKLERLRIITEVVGIVAVVASAVALIFELRQTRDVIQASTYANRAAGQIEFNTALFDSMEMLPLLASLQTRDPARIAALSDTDRLRLRVFFSAIKVDLDNEYYQYELGLLDEDHIEYVLKPTIRSNAPAWRSLGVDDGRPAFKAFVDSTLSESQPGDDSFAP